MVNKTILLHQVEALQSSLDVLFQAAQGICGPVDHVEFLRAEVPLAIEDAQAALRHLRDMVAAIEEAA